jgi:phage-related protein
MDMSELTLSVFRSDALAMAGTDKPLAWLHGEIKTPPFSPEARIEAGVLLRRLQRGEGLGLPHSRPLPAIGQRCHELRVPDENRTWRIVYHLADDAVVLLEVFEKKTRRTPLTVIATCRDRLQRFRNSTQPKPKR